MPNTVRIKRRGSGSAGAPSTLENAELAFNEVDNTLYYGEGTGGSGGSASTILAIGGDGAFVNKTAAQTISGDKTFTGGFDISSASVSGFTVTQNLVITGNLTVNGTTTTVNSTTMSVDDKNLELGATSSPSDSGASGGGITLKGTSDKTFNWIDSTDSWTSSEHIELASGKNFRIDGVSVVSKTGLGSTVLASSLTSTGTITSGVWSATDIAVAHGGTGASTASAARTNLGVAIGTDVEPHTDKLTELSTMAQATADSLADLTSTEVQILDGLTTTTAELNKLDGATVTTTEINKLDGNTSATATTLALADRMVVNDNGTMVQVAFSDLVTFLENGAVSGFDIDGGTY
tara:strand:+ start:440 stop:1486 length:1047 start_codon:yes stop_codon:yes gene_type:complete